MNAETAPMTRQEAERLLPWYAEGLLDEAEAAEMAALLAKDGNLAAQLALIEEEREATVAASEALPEPAPGAAERFMARLEREERFASQHREAPRPGLIARFGGFFQSLSPRQVAFAAVLLLAVIVGQGAIIGLEIGGREAGIYQTAGSEDQMASGSVLLVAFRDDATLGKINAMLARYQAQIVAGPMPGGLFRIRFHSEESREALADALQRQTELVRMVLPGE